MTERRSFLADGNLGQTKTSYYMNIEGLRKLGSWFFRGLKSYLEDSRRSKYLLFISIFLILFFLNNKYVSQNLNLPQWVALEIKSDQPIQIQVYYDIGEGYSERDKRIQLVSGSQYFQKVRVRLPSKILNSFRIDPLTTPGVVFFKSIALESLFGRNYVWSAEKIQKDFHPQNDISQFQLENGILKVESNGIDPYFGVNASVPVINKIDDGWVILILFGLSLVYLLFNKMIVVIRERWKVMAYHIWFFRLRMGFILVGVFLPFFLAINLIRRCSISIPYWDQWEFVPLLGAFFGGKPWFHLLVDFHNEHKLIFPRIIFLASAVTTKWDVIVENYINLLFICITLIVNWKLLKETGRSLIILVPISWLLFSLQQWENYLGGWPMAIPVMVSAVVVSIFYLNRVGANGYYIVPALISGACASFSFLEGLLLWPLGLLQMLMVRGKKWAFLAWIIGGGLTIGFYFMGYHKPPGTPDVFIFLKNPLGYIKYIMGYLGSGLSEDSLRQSFVYGAILVVFFISAVLFQMLKMRRWKNLVPWIMMGLFSLLCGGMIGIGRLGYGVDQALSSRYISISSIFIISTLILSAISAVDFYKKTKHILLKDFIVTSLLVTTMILFLGFANSYISGWREGYYQKLIRGQFSRSLYDMKKANDDELKMIYWNVEILKERATILKNLKIGPYATTAK